mmetsp:Transcript_18887/g.23160  ORF Transcript_18887/g.23160 Transcript_18887/m.23160 type:complete len:255 (-) Transcript_18887:826-1590(-)
MLLACCKRICTTCPGLVILDDGMQHWAMHRDIEVLMINSVQGMTKDFVCNTLPSGILREPWKDAISRTNVAVFNHVDLVTRSELDEMESKVRQLADDTKNHNLQILFAKMRPHSLISCYDIFFCPIENRQQPDTLTLPNSVSQVHVVCGIACPETFKRHILKLFPKVDTRFHCFPDHHPFTSEDMNGIKTKCFQNLKFSTRPTRPQDPRVAIITTEKDYYRCPAIFATSFSESSLISTYYLSMHLDVQKYPPAD